MVLTHVLDTESIDGGDVAISDDENGQTPLVVEWTPNNPRVDPFIRYLTYLTPTKSGSVECPSCHWSFDSELQLDDISSHFQACDLEKLDMTGEVAQNEPQEAVDRLRRRCLAIQARREQLRIATQARLPSVDGFLDQMRPFCDGRLACIGPGCRYDQPFDASWDHLKSHYEDCHAHRLLQDEDIRDLLDVDSHLSCYKDDIEKLFARAQACREEWASMGHFARFIRNERCTQSLKCDNSVYRRLLEMPQFGVLKDVDKVFRSRYRKFRRLAAKSSLPGLPSFTKELGRKYPNPKDLRRLGTGTFKQVLRGSSPSTLLEIFAFISLSQAMATVMGRRGVRVDLDPGTIDYLAWRDCIKDDLDRSQYDHILMMWFHPRWKEELHCMSPLNLLISS